MLLGEAFLDGLVIFKGRKQQVISQCVRSECREVVSGVLQGLVLGPLLFVLYTNGPPETIPNSAMFLYANDTKVL